MLDKKQEYITEALDEIRDEYIEEAVNYKGQAGADLDGVDWIINGEEKRDVPGEDEVLLRKSKKYRFVKIGGSLAACLVVVVALSVAISNGGIFGATGTSSSNMGAASETAESASDTAAGEAQDSADQFGQADGEENDAAAPEESQIAEGTDPGSSPEEGEAAQESELTSGNGAGSLMWYEPEEIFAQDIAIFRGTVESIVDVTSDSVDGSGAGQAYTQITVKVTSCLKGDLKEGDLCVIRLPILLSYQNYYDDYYMDLTKLSEGSEAIFMPRVGEPYYFNEGRRYLFLETMDGVSYAEEVYDIPSEGAVTLDDVEEYIREMLQ